MRTLYASGLYHKSDLYVRFAYCFESPEDFLALMNYSSYPDIRPDLSNKIIGLNFIFDIMEEYHQTLQQAVASEVYEGADNFPEVKESAIKVLEEKLAFINKEFGLTFSLFDLQSRLYLDI